MRYELKPGRIEIHTDGEYEGKTLQQFLEDMQQSKKNRYLLVLNQRIQIDRKFVKNENELLGKKSVISIDLPEEEVDYQPAEEECQVVYEDDFVYIAHKSAGMIVHGNDTDCLACQAARYQINHGIQAPVRYIHRLDEETSGVILFVKIPFFQPWFDHQLEERKIHRHYLAITEGKGAPGQHFTYRQKIGKDRHVNGKYRFSSTGKEAVTHVEFLEKKGNYLLIGCELETGRTHQIRVHLSGNHQPIVNDELYGLPSADFSHMGLWADKITFSNPITHEEITANDIMNPDYAYFDTFSK